MSRGGRRWGACAGGGRRPPTARAAGFSEAARVRASFCEGCGTYVPPCLPALGPPPADLAPPPPHTHTLPAAAGAMSAASESEMRAGCGLSMWSRRLDRWARPWGWHARDGVGWGPGSSAVGCC